MRQVSLCFLIKEENGNITDVLLALKKKGFGLNKWNGVGGKPKTENGEDVLASAFREVEEEICVKIKNPEKVAILDFYFPEELRDKNWDQQVHTYFVREWEGEPIETEEMAPRWFKVGEIPFDNMWSDDRFWVPLVLAGKKVRATFHFDEKDELRKQDVNVVEKFEI